jgi:hypothetical protein
MNNRTPNADAPVPPEGTEQTVERVTNQIAKQQQPPQAEESSTLDTVSTVVEGVSGVADIIFSIFDD